MKHLGLFLAFAVAAAAAEHLPDFATLVVTYVPGKLCLSRSSYTFSSTASDGRRGCLPNFVGPPTARPRRRRSHEPNGGSSEAASDAAFALE